MPVALVLFRSDICCRFLRCLAKNQANSGCPRLPW